MVLDALVMAAPLSALDGFALSSLPHELFDTLESEPSAAYALDENLNISYCNPAWDRFASANAGPGAQSARLHGTSILASMSEPLRSFFQAVFLSALATGVAWQQVYECSTPTHYRRFRMHVWKLEGPNTLIVTNFLEVECPHQSTRESKPIDASLYLSSEGFLAMCSNCRRVRQTENAETWDWVPDYVRDVHTNISHGICPICVHHFLAMA